MSVRFVRSGEGAPVVGAVQDTSPAARSGLAPGDEVVAADGAHLAAMRLLHGDPGTIAKLSERRGTIVRDVDLVLGRLAGADRAVTDSSSGIKRLVPRCVAVEKLNPALQAEVHPSIAPGVQSRSELFAFHSSFWLNLHHFLYVTARAQKGLDARRPAVMSALADTAGFGALSVSDQKEWRAAVAYYDSTLARRDILFDLDMVAINNRLTRADSATTLRGSGIDASLVAVLDRIAPVYRRLWWSRHDAANHRWEARMRELLAVDGDSIAKRESRVFRESWSSTPPRVDVTAYANWAGAYTTNGPTHITVSSEDGANQDDQGLEILFHEVGHTMVDTLLSSLNAAFRKLGKAPPRDPTHVSIFYTAGVLTRQTIAAHVPYAEKNGLWTQVPDFRRALPVLRRSWQPYLDGNITFEEAVERYAADF
ncbi:MAG: hypothetical protein ABI625_14245 [bacterium]